MRSREALSAAAALECLRLEQASRRPAHRPPAASRRRATAAMGRAEVLQCLRTRTSTTRERCRASWPATSRACGAGEPMRLFRSERPDYPDGGQVRDFIYVKDCVDVHAVVAGAARRSRGCSTSAPGSPAAGWTWRGALFSAAQLPEAVEFIDMPATLAGEVPVLHRSPDVTPAAGRLHEALHHSGGGHRRVRARLPRSQRPLPLRQSQPVSLRRRGSGRICAATLRQAANTSPTDTWSARLECGGPPTLTTGEP